MEISFCLRESAWSLPYRALERSNWRDISQIPACCILPRCFPCVPSMGYTVSTDIMRLRIILEHRRKAGCFVSSHRVSHVHLEASSAVQGCGR